jgi:MFS family permease
MLALLALAELLGMSLWFAASAVSAPLSSALEPHPLRDRLAHHGGAGGVRGGHRGLGLLNLADVVPARVLFAAAAVLGAAANAALLALPDGEAGYRGALVCRFVTGIALAGVYPPAMKMVATWFRSARGLAVGTLVGALTIGKATPYLVHAIPGAGVRPCSSPPPPPPSSPRCSWRWGYREGPFPFPARPFSWGLTGRSSASAGGASPRAATSGTCGSCTRVDLAARLHRGERRRARVARRRSGARGGGGVGGGLRGARGGGAGLRVGRASSPTGADARRS